MKFMTFSLKYAREGMASSKKILQLARECDCMMMMNVEIGSGGIILLLFYYYIFYYLL